MFRRSTNNPWIPVGGLNSGYFSTIGGEDPSPGAGARFPGLLGQTVVHSNKTALQDSFKNPNGVTITLFEGVYQLVKFSSAIVGSTGFAGTVKQGSLVFWDTLANNGINNFQVTDVPTATGDFKAGAVVCIDTLIGNVAGKFGYIQVAGLVNMLYSATTDITIGNLVFQGNSGTVPSLTTNLICSLDDADVTTLAGSVASIKGRVGIAYETPAVASLRRVLLDTNSFYYNIG